MFANIDSYVKLRSMKRTKLLKRVTIFVAIVLLAPQLLYGIMIWAPHPLCDYSRIILSKLSNDDYDNPGKAFVEGRINCIGGDFY